MVIVSGVVAVWEPDLPVMVTVYCPREAVLAAVKVSVPAVIAEAGFGLKDALTPLGRPETERLTLPVKPLRELI
jgi:hypothetical protein